jgi:cytochrome c-type biogenesis protein CcmH/NrfG
VLYNRQDKQADAQAAVAQAVQKSPNDSRFWYGYGEIFRVQGRLTDAIDAYRKALALDPPYPKAIGKLGLVLVEHKQYEDAEAFLIQGIRKDKTNPVNYLHLGAVYAAKKKNKLAIENLERFLELAPKNDPDRARARNAIQDLRRR